MPKDDRSSIEEVEKLLGRRVDRRRIYKVIDGEVCVAGQATMSCSGCHETVDGYHMRGQTYDKNGVPLGAGCEECGHQGKVIDRFWVPIRFAELSRQSKKPNNRAKTNEHV